MNKLTQMLFFVRVELQVVEGQKQEQFFLALPSSASSPYLTTLKSLSDGGQAGWAFTRLDSCTASTWWPS